MLKQAPLGAMTSFLYDNAAVLDAAYKIGVKGDYTNVSIIEEFGKDIFASIDALAAASANNSVRAVLRRLMLLSHEGVKGIAPNASFADSMALTEANYDCTDFKMPYPTVVIEIPEACRGYIRLNRANFSQTIIKLYEKLWGIDMELMFTRGAEARYIVVTETERELQRFESFDGEATKHISIEIMMSEFMKGPITKPIADAGFTTKFQRDDGSTTSMAFNPAPVTFFGRPMIKGQTVEKVFMQRVWNTDDSPGTIKLNDDAAPMGIDLRWTQGSELEYTQRVTRMAMNIIFALVNMGYDEVKRVASDKIIRRGSNVAKRVIPDVLSPTTVMSAELKKFKYDESFTETDLVMSPHFRRGHWRKQRHGAELKLIKNVWIMPTVVNKHLLRAGEDKGAFSNR